MLGMEVKPQHMCCCHLLQFKRSFRRQEKQTKNKLKKLQIANVKSYKKRNAKPTISET